MKLITRETMGEKLFYITYRPKGELFEEVFDLWEFPGRLRLTLNFLSVRNGWEMIKAEQKDFYSGKLREVKID